MHYQDYLSRKKFNPVRKIRTAINGFLHVFFGDFSFTYKVFLSILALIMSVYYKDTVDFMIILLATGCVLSVEITNSTIEAMADFVEPKYNQQIKIIKNMASASAGVCIIVWTVIILWEYWEVFDRLVTM